MACKATRCSCRNQDPPMGNGSYKISRLVGNKFPLMGLPNQELPLPTVHKLMILTHSIKSYVLDRETLRIIIQAMPNHIGRGTTEDRLRNQNHLRCDLHEP